MRESPACLFEKLAPDLAVKSILRGPLVIATPTAHAFTGKKRKIDDLSEEPFILLQRDGAPTVYDAILGMCQKRGFAPRVAREADVMHTLFTLVAAGQGIALVPACVMNQHPEGVRFIRCNEMTTRQSLFWHGVKTLHRPRYRFFSG